VDVVLNSHAVPLLAHFRKSATTPVPKHTGHDPTVSSSFSITPYQQPSATHLGASDNTGSLITDPVRRVRVAVLESCHRHQNNIQRSLLEPKPKPAYVFSR
jgi:hypothetical protein